MGFGVGGGGGAVLGAAGDPVPGLGGGGTALLDAGLLGGVGAFFGMVLDPFFHGRSVYRRPQDPYKAHNAPSLPHGRNTSQPPANVPSCLRDGVTSQCVDQ